MNLRVSILPLRGLTLSECAMCSYMVTTLQAHCLYGIPTSKKLWILLNLINEHQRVRSTAQPATGNCTQCEIELVSSAYIAKHSLAFGILRKIYLNEIPKEPTAYFSDDKRLTYLTSTLDEKYLVRAAKQMLLYVFANLSV